MFSSVIGNALAMLVLSQIKDYMCLLIVDYVTKSLNDDDEILEMNNEYILYYLILEIHNDIC